MAILTGVPGLSVQIQVAGEIATEYPDPNFDDAGDANFSIPNSRSYIEAKDGSKFTIEATIGTEFAIPNGSDSVAIYVHIDGVSIPGISRKFNRHRTAPQTITCSEAWTASSDSNMCVKRHFVFIPLSVVEEQASLSAIDVQTIKSCGCIKISVYTARRTGPIPFTPIDFDARDSISAPEKLIKGKDLSHRSSLTDGVMEVPPLACELVNKKKAGIFHFFYKSREALQRCMIIPRSPSPSPTALLRNELNSLSENEIRRLAEERLRDIKGNVESQQVVKREAESPPPTRSQPWKMVKLDDGREAIDLSED